MPKRLVRAALPVALGVFAFIFVGYLSGWRPANRATSDAMWNQRIEAFTVHDVPLQVAVHDLTESAKPGTAIRVCRSLAARLVTMELTSPQPLPAVLDRLAAQVGVASTLATSRLENRALPTIQCPDGPGDYLVIGSQAGLDR
jgi:uncharacterized protein (DUF2236 family)